MNAKRVEEVIAALDRGELRVAEPDGDDWRGHAVAIDRGHDEVGQARERTAGPRVVRLVGLGDLVRGVGRGDEGPAYGLGSRIRGGIGSCVKSKSFSRFPRIGTFSRTVGRESGRLTVAGSSRCLSRNRSSISLRYASNVSVW